MHFLHCADLPTATAHHCRRRRHRPPQVTSPIGVLLIIFEARPDALPQIAALAIRSGNGLLLKVGWVGGRADCRMHCTPLPAVGPSAHTVPPRTLSCCLLHSPPVWMPQGGKEATRSNALLHRLIVDAVAEVAPSVGRGLIGLVTSRDEIDALLKLHDVIDLVIPRGSNQLVSEARGEGGMMGAYVAPPCALPRQPEPAPSPPLSLSLPHLTHPLLPLEPPPPSPPPLPPTR